MIYRVFYVCHGDELQTLCDGRKLRGLRAELERAGCTVLRVVREPKDPHLLTGGSN